MLIVLMKCLCTVELCKKFSAVTFCFCSDAIGDCVIAGDARWGGSFGVNIDFVARRCRVLTFLSMDEKNMTCFAKII